jgi:hypothetical protein
MEGEMSSKHVQDMNKILDEKDELTMNPPWHPGPICYLPMQMSRAEIDENVRIMISQKLLDEKVITAGDYGRIVNS